jgi:uncharacterized peroxidase-related enzyme
MARLSTVEPDGATPEVKAVYEAFLRERGAVPNMFKTLAHRPEILKTVTATFKAILGTGTLTLALKEMIGVAVSRANGCAYCNASHTMIAERLGVPRATLDALRDPATAPIAPRERAAVAFALAMTTDSNNVPDALVAELKSHFTEGEIVEIGCVAGIFNFFNRFNNALEVDLTKYSGDK